MSAKILVVDDDTARRLALRDVLFQAGHEVDTAEDGAQGCALIGRGGFEVVVTSLLMRGTDGMAVLRYAKAYDPRLLVVVLVTRPPVSSVVRAMRLGASDVLDRPVSSEVLLGSIRAALRGGEPGEPVRVAGAAPAKQKVRPRPTDGRTGPPNWGDFPHVIGRSEAMLSVFRRVKRAAPSTLPLLIIGETATGRGLIARELHQLGRPRGPLVSTSDLPLRQVESRLLEDARAWLASATHGTFFIEEVGDLALPVQVELTHAIDWVIGLRERGDSAGGVRLVASTRHDLEAEAARRRFSGSLLYRLKALTIRIPPLRDRESDVLQLAEYFLEAAARGTTRNLTLGYDARKALLRHRWPGNLSEIRQVCQSLVLMAEEEVVSADDVALVLG